VSAAAGMPAGADPTEAAVFYHEAVETLQALLGDITAAGIVFPVDLRLRPGSKGSGFAASLASMAQYYREWAAPWGGQTLPRARLAAGSPAVGRRVRRL